MSQIGVELSLNRHRPFPERLVFTLNNRIRGLLSPPEQLISKLDVGPDNVVVGFGCGPGFFTVPLAKVAGEVIGIDVSPRMLKKAAHHARTKGVAAEFLRSDGSEIWLRDASVETISLTNRRQIESSQRIPQTMKPSGRLAIVERTRGSSILSGKLGPPIISEAEVIRELAETYSL